jgi:hypothetical protein
MSEETKRPDIDAIEARWEGSLVTIGARASDLYDHARADIPALLAYVRALKAERDALKAREREAGELLRGLLPLAVHDLWAAREYICAACQNAASSTQSKPEDVQHAPDCPVTCAWAWLDGAATD